MTKHEYYSKVSKLDAANLPESGDTTVTKLVRGLGIRRNLLYKWQKEARTKVADAFRGRGKRPAGSYLVAYLVYGRDYGRVGLIHLHNKQRGKHRLCEIGILRRLLSCPKTIL